MMADFLKMQMLLEEHAAQGMVSYYSVEQSNEYHDQPTTSALL